MSKEQSSRVSATDHKDNNVGSAVTNVVVLIGEVVTDPVDSELPDGVVVTNCDVATYTDLGRMIVPIVLSEVSTPVRLGDEICAVGFVRKRFYRTGGAVQSRTEVVVKRNVRVRQKAQMQRLLEHVADDLLTAS
jgi:hypothetical protein